MKKRVCENFEKCKIFIKKTVKKRSKNHQKKGSKKGQKTRFFTTFRPPKKCQNGAKNAPVLPGDQKKYGCGRTIKRLGFPFFAL